MKSTPTKKALIFQGGWDGHEPGPMSELTALALREAGYEVQLQSSLDCLDDLTALQTFDLIVPVWTMGELTPERQKNLCEAVRTGTGLAGFHGGMADAFRGSLNYEWMVGGRFVGHPYVGPYRVHVMDAEHPIMAGLAASFDYDSEQYYLQVDPGIRVLASTVYEREGQCVNMPVVWTKPWGKGRVFCSALGHKSDEFKKYPHVWDMTVRGLVWACR
ncbi:MAG: ThuA domain-containing protein [Puniceicoccales bacterium]